jgi:Protein of unknown function (DUF1501)
MRNPMICPGLTRRDYLRLTTAGVLGGSVSGWLGQLAAATAADPQRKRACILLWMNGGPSQMDTFDLKPGHANGGPCKEIDTAAPGLRFTENLPLLAKHADRLAVVRSMSTKEADHGRATYLLRTGRVPGGPIQYPAFGAVVAKELEAANAELPGFVSVSPFRAFNAAAYGSGFLGPRYAPLVVGEDGNRLVVQQRDQANELDRRLRVQDLDLPEDVDARRASARIGLLDEMEDDFLADRAGSSAQSHQTAYRRAVTLMNSKAVKAFDLSEEPAALRESYGRNLFGQGCLLARRLVEQGVPFVEVTLAGVPQANVPGWDTHQNNFAGVKSLCGVLDPAWSTLMSDLKTRGLLDTTLIVWMGEFGRTPKINGQNGRDHWANAWSTVLAGGGIKGGQAIGKTSADGMEITERPVSVPDFLATVSQALGIDPRKQNDSNVGRPIRVVDPNAQAIKEVLA